MEQFLECYLDDFKEAPRNSLHDRRNRKQMVDYINTLILGCSGAHDDGTETTCQEAIMTLIRYHEKAKTANGTVCMMGKYHNILYVAMKLCYLWQMQDAELVSKLLSEIYMCEHNFERILIGAVFGTKAPHYIAGWKSDFENQEENVRGVVYFTDKANHAKLELPLAVKDKVKKYRLIDLPLESCGNETALKLCIQLGLPDKLLIFLRFGASISNQLEVATNFEYILNRLMEFKHCYPYNLVACLQLLLRVSPSISVHKEDVPVNENISVLTRDILIEGYSNLINDGIIPLPRCGFKPPELKHLCRCRIRNQLWKNFNLPHGIRRLPLPEQMWRYVDILAD